MTGWRKLWLAAPYLPLAAGLLFLDNAWIATFGFHGVILLALWANRKRGSPSMLWRGGGLAWLPVAAVLTAAGGVLLLRIAAGYPGYDGYLHKVMGRLGVADAAMVPLAVYICLVNPFLEEAFWRGLFFEETPGPALPDLAYGGIHVIIFLPFMYAYQAALGAIFLVVLGWLWRTLARRYGGLALPLAWHLLADVTILLVAARFVRAG